MFFLEGFAMPWFALSHISRPIWFTSDSSDVILAEFQEATFLFADFAGADVFELILIFLKLIFFLSDFHDFRVQQSHTGIILYGLFSSPIFFSSVSLPQFISSTLQMCKRHFGVGFVETHGILGVISSMLPN